MQAEGLSRKGPFGHRHWFIVNYNQPGRYCPDQVTGLAGSLAVHHLVHLAPVHLARGHQPVNEDAVAGFHVLQIYGDHVRKLREFCQLYRIEAVHSWDERVSFDFEPNCA